MKKRLLFILSLFSLIAILGGCSVNKISNEQVKKTENDLAKYIVSRYSDVETITFKKWGYSNETGYWGVTVIVNKTNKISFSLGDRKDITSISGISYHSDSFHLLENEENKDDSPVSISKKIISNELKVDLSNVTITYSSS
ncbi:hypothetical protein [Streptococcus loxodontisalivarius]|uniref:Lipoprotein n=1 Tax=Streptococcus loxodontisalivarius TaxID=1349415 RepID=A0ABS2PRT2_9STRE|nr:hypothetical protein [Streptococcus loxodontisalivarius]MBM7642749.1 hypothetical protein [Streptococcus loxodontisalivarius]